MDAWVEVTSESPADEVRSLREWLVAEESLRGLVRLVAGAPEPGTLGGGIEALAVALGNGGAFTAFATIAVTWLRRRAGRTVVKITRADGSTMEFSSDLVRPQTVQELQETVEGLARALGLDSREGVREAPQAAAPADARNRTGNAPDDAPGGTRNDCPADCEGTCSE